MIRRCIDEDEKRRLTAKQLREHAFLKEFIPSPLAHDKDQFAALYVHKGMQIFLAGFHVKNNYCNVNLDITYVNLNNFF